MLEGKGRGGHTTSFDGPAQISIPQPELQLPTSMKPEYPAGWNTSSLGLRFGADASSAAVASALVAPLICIIDRSIVTKAATNTPFLTCLSAALRPALSRPHHFLVSRPFLLIFSLYFGTYLTANTVDTISSTLSNKSSASTTSNTAKFVATSAVNMSACVYKDSQFARLFGKPSSGPAAAIPRLSYILFAARDSMTIFASFNLPSIIAPKLTQLPPAVQSRLKSIIGTESGRTKTAQFVTPAAMQIFSTPIHLLGLDLYNRQGRLGLGARASRVVRDWGVSALARMGRIVPAFGVGGVVNADLRRNLMMKME